MGELKKGLKYFNLVLTDEILFKPRLCEYYLHFDINLPYPEEELKNCIANRDKYALGKDKKNQKKTP